MIGSQRTEGQRGADRRRNIELALLGFAYVVCLAAYIDADEAMNNKLPRACWSTGWRSVR